MNSRQKRSSGGYGLRRKIAKKRLDEDFEYYFSKIGTPYESRIIKSEDSSSKMPPEEFETELQKPNVKATVRNKDSLGKKRGRPRKIHLSVQHHEPDISETNLKFVDLKEKRSRKPKLLYIDQSESSKLVDEIRDRNNVEDVAHEEEVEDDSISKRLKLDVVLSEEMTELREEEVSSLPEGEKENLPEEGVSLDSFPEERPAGGEIDTPEVEIFEGEELGKEGALINKTKRKYRRNRLTQETIRKLNLMNPHDKIECNECHKLLKPSSFRQHLRTHTGEKPFGCEVCSARFTRKGDVERHVRIVHNKQKPFKCCRCQRAFGDKKNLRWHLMNHDKKLFYICETCGFKFGKREYWENHVRFIHPLPGGVDPSAVDGDMDDERLEALTDSLLEDEESMEDNYENGSSEEYMNVGDFVQTSLVQRVPGMECKVIKSEELSTVPVKNFPNLVKVSRPKEKELMNSPGVYVVNENSTVDAVVIQINEPSGCNEVKSESMGSVYPTNLIRVVPSKSESEDVNEESDNPIIIDAQECSVQENSGHSSERLLVQMDNSGDTGSQLTGQEPPTKVFRLVVNNSDGDSRSNVNMHNFIEVLLDAANGQKHAAEVVPSS